MTEGKHFFESESDVVGVAEAGICTRETNLSPTETRVPGAVGASRSRRGVGILVVKRRVAADLFQICSRTKEIVLF